MMGNGPGYNSALRSRYQRCTPGKPAYSVSLWQNKTASSSVLKYCFALATR